MGQKVKNFRYTTEFLISEKTILLWNYRTIIHGDLTLKSGTKKIKLDLCKLEIANKNDNL